MLPSIVMLCIFAMPALAQSSTPTSAPALAVVDALADARIMEPEAVARALKEVVRINPTPTDSADGGWLADLRGFDGSERQELSALLRSEGVGLGDRSKLRRLATATQSIAMLEGNAKIGIQRRAQQLAGGGEESSTTNKQLKKQQGDHAGTAQSSGKQADDDSGLSADSACSPSF